MACILRDQVHFIEIVILLMRKSKSTHVLIDRKIIDSHDGIKQNIL